MPKVDLHASKNMRKPPIIANHNGLPNPTAGRGKFLGALSLRTPLLWCRRSSGHKHPGPRLCWEVHHMILHLGDVHIIPLGHCTYNLAGPGCRPPTFSSYIPGPWHTQNVRGKINPNHVTRKEIQRRGPGHQSEAQNPGKREQSTRIVEEGLPAVPKAWGRGQVTQEEGKGTRPRALTLKMLRMAQRRREQRWQGVHVPAWCAGKQQAPCRLRKIDQRALGNTHPPISSVHNSSCLRRELLAEVRLMLPQEGRHSGGRRMKTPNVTETGAATTPMESSPHAAATQLRRLHGLSQTLESALARIANNPQALPPKPQRHTSSRAGFAAGSNYHFNTSPQQLASRCGRVGCRSIHPSDRRPRVMRRQAENGSACTLAARGICVRQRVDVDAAAAQRGSEMGCRVNPPSSQATAVVRGARGVLHSKHGGSREAAVVRGARGVLRSRHGVARGIPQLTQADVAENGPACTLAARGMARRCWGEPVPHALIGDVGVKPMGPGALSPRASSRGGQAWRERPFAVLCAGEEARDGAVEIGPACTPAAQAFTDRSEVLALDVALGMAPPLGSAARVSDRRRCS
ncbi:hypothetical protein B0H14DRAFT_2657362 [Mycena olivaceomarginata]|nr:hypothetical protein B0H14DRAFT_2657362 [Mycena olivaceomarginata]